MKPTLQTLSLWICATLALGLASCATHIYSQLQDDFAEQVERDNLRSASPFFDDDLTAPDAEFERIAKRLSESTIADLPAELQPNAWMLRAISFWRSGQGTEANAAAQKGLALVPMKGTREDVILRMITGLVIDQEMSAKWTDVELRSMEIEPYEAIAEDYGTAMEELDQAKASVTSHITPASVSDYLTYHRWRVLQNWRLATMRVKTDSLGQAYSISSKLLGKSLSEAIRSEENALSSGSSYRELIQAQKRK